MPRKSKRIPIIDLFAGPGGLGEGFSSVVDKNGKRRFEIKLSIEKDPVAHKTLTLRAFYRQFDPANVPEDYYLYLAGEITRDDLEARWPKQWTIARDEARCLELGKDDVDGLIGDRVNPKEPWVLIGGPPCQAYSLVGRARMDGKGQRRRGESEAEFEQRVSEQRAAFAGDHRHKLYLEYLKVIAGHWPAMFVMENVKGILSAKVDGERIFPQIRNDLQNPGAAVDGKKRFRYRLFSFVAEKPPVGDSPDQDFLIRAEEYGIPQTRHRVIILGIRSDIAPESIAVLPPVSPPTVKETISDLPELTSGLSKAKGEKIWDAISAIQEEPWWVDFVREESSSAVALKMSQTIRNMRKKEKRSAPSSDWKSSAPDEWFADPALVGWCNHETRTHIREDLWRYLFCASFAQIHKKSPHLRDFPDGLLPLHRNVKQAQAGQKFGDRFRVQRQGFPAKTVTSHISKDGHYFIHYDPKQCRSLTVREAARLQTFPDNYFFEGPRTQQYHQVGNAVPPCLANQLAQIVSGLKALL